MGDLVAYVEARDVYLRCSPMISRMPTVNVVNLLIGDKYLVCMLALVGSFRKPCTRHHCTRVTCLTWLTCPSLDRCAYGASSRAASFGLGNGTAKRRVGRRCSSRAEHDVQATTAGLRAIEAVSLPGPFIAAAIKLSRAERESLSRILKGRVLSLTPAVELPLSTRELVEQNGTCWPDEVVYATPLLSHGTR